MPIDLIEEYGYEGVTLYATFIEGDVAGKFISDVALNENKSVRLKNNSGNYRKWVCSARGCKWFVAMSSKRVKQDTKSARKRPITKLSHVPDNAWYISKVDLDHSQVCSSTANPSGSQIERTSGFQAAVLEGYNTSKQRIVRNLQVVEGIDVSSKNSVLYRTISSALTKLESDSSEEFQAFPSYLDAFAKENPGSRVCCQLDHAGRFFRAFLSIGSIVNVQNSLLPVWECDGTHMKHSRYNGICLTLIGKDGNKRIVPVAVAYVHKETVGNFVWFFANCIASGVSLSDRPTFSDRGKQLLAQVALSSMGLPVHIKFCAVHIRFNTVDKFKKVKVTKANVNDPIMSLQSSRTIRDFERNIKNLRNRFQNGITSIRDEKPVEEHVWSYLKAIHPMSWTVLGNSTLTAQENKWIENNWKDIPAYGEGLSLFGVRSTSGAEGDNNGLLWKRARNNLVLGAVKAYCLRAVDTHNTLLQEAKGWIAGGFDITPHAMKLFEAEKKHVAKLTVVPIKGSSFYVFDPFDRSDVASSTMMYETNLASGICRPCRVQEQLRIPCRHIQAVLFYLERKNPGKSPLYAVLQYFHPAYLVRTVHKAMSDVIIKLPVGDISTHGSIVLPAPIYRQAGGSRRSRIADSQRGEKRIRSRGEEPKSSRSRMNSHPLLNAENTDEHDDTSAINAFFESQITAKSTPRRSQYTCSKCGEVGHNTTTCTFTGQDVELVGEAIRPGEYVLGSSPLEACGVSRNTFIGTDYE
ncbi:Actin-1 [Phytophthora nicotianae]|uniref:Actin-1 n=1 Tax=Phytophthora nicotianae TaxID=4792 RepID=A0A0W8CWF0_PHYNI|nr:Actin-1 [Phytophthora nicotianae]